MAKSVYLGQNISRAPKEKSAWTSPTTVLTGDTTVTIYDSRIKSSSIIKKYVEPFSDGEVLGVSNIQITNGQAVLTFSSAAKANTTIKLEIIDGEGFKEVTLWENPSPSTDMDATTVTLSDSLTNYNFIKVYYTYSTTYNTEQYQYSEIMPMETFVKSVYPIQNYMPQMQLGVYASISNVRGVMYASPTSVRFSPANNVAQSGVSNNRCIPTKITGLTELNQVKIRNAKIENVLWTNSAPTSSFAAQNVTLSDSLSNYDYIKVTYRISTSDATSTSAICSVNDFKNYNTGTNKGFWLSLGGNPINSQSWVRELTYVSDTSIGITGGLRIQANANDTNYFIPTSIVGIKEVSTHKADIYGAAQDTIYYSTNGTDWTVVGQTDSNGYLANAVLPDTAFILKSSVAKNPEDLTADYTKVFNTDSNVLKFMPDNCLYWYGYNGGVEAQNTSSGWSLQNTSWSFAVPTFNLNSITMAASTSQHSGIASKNTILASKLKAISGVKSGSDGGTAIGILGTKVWATDQIAIGVYDTADALIEVTNSTSRSGYIVIGSDNGRTRTCYALWYE